jgi:microcystin-dependent protein
MKTVMRARDIGGAALGCLLALGAAALPAHAFGPDDYLGSVGLFAGNFCPNGTLEAAGQLVSIAENEALFQLYGTTYGGDGQTDFALPDMSGTVPASDMRYCVTTDGAYPSEK